MNMNSPLLVSSILGLTALNEVPSSLGPMPTLNKVFKVGRGIGEGVPAGETFTDSRGRKYVRDEKGVIRCA